MELCGDADAGEIQNKLVSDNERFEKLKLQARGKVRELADARQNMTQEVNRRVGPSCLKLTTLLVKVSLKLFFVGKM